MSLRTERFLVRLSGVEKGYCRRRAGEVKMTVSGWVRSRLFEGAGLELADSAAATVAVPVADQVPAPVAESERVAESIREREPNPQQFGAYSGAGVDLGLYTN